MNINYLLLVHDSENRYNISIGVRLIFLIYNAYSTGGRVKWLNYEK